jgi:chitosanase
MPDIPDEFERESSNMLNDLQKRTGKAIVNIFETGHPLGIYGKVTLIKGDTGHLTYGCSQTTLAAGTFIC